MSYHDRLISRALKVAEDSAHPRWRLGAVVLQGRTVLSYSPNIVRKRPALDSGWKSTWHAEEAALRRLWPLERLLTRQTL